MTTATQATTCATEAAIDRDRLITDHMSLVQMIARHVQRSLPVHVDLDDMTHAGILGLIDAADKYKAGKDVSFSAYAKHRIRGAILDSMRQADWVSRDTRKRVKQVESTRQSLTAQLGREATDEEVAGALNLDRERWQQLMLDVRTAQSATQVRVDRDDDAPVREVPGNVADRPDQMFAAQQTRGRMQMMIQSLPARYQDVLNAYYVREMTMKEIAEDLGVRESRISQIHKAALALLQDRLAQDGINSAMALAA